MAVSFKVSSTDFGTHYVGRSCVETILVDNPGTAPIALEIGGLAGTTTEFLFESGGSVPAGAVKHEVKIRFTPSTPRAFNATLRDTGGTKTVALAGVGKSPESIGIDRTDQDGDGVVQRDEVSRFRVHVPYASTTLVMGRGATDPKTYDGFGVRTGGRFFVHAEKNLVVQSMGTSVYKAIGVEGSDEKELKGNLYVVAGNDAVLAGVNSANVLGADGVLIAGGLGGLKAETEPGDRAEPFEVVDNDGAEQVRANRTKVATGVLIFDAMFALSGAAATTYVTVRSLPKDGLANMSWKKTLGLATTAAGVITGVTGAALSIAAGAGAKGIGGTTIFGASSVTVGSFGYNCSYSAAGLAQAAPVVTTVGLFDISTIGLHAATVAAVFGSTAIYGRRKVAINSSNAVRLTAGKGPTGEVSIDAGKVTIGDSEKQCMEIAINAMGGAATGAGIKLEGAGGKLSMGALTTVEAKTAGGASLTLGPLGVTGKMAQSLLVVAADGAAMAGPMCELQAKTSLTLDGGLEVKIKGAKVSIC